MSDFNYQAYLKNNPLTQKEVEENKLITESQEIEETVEVNEEEIQEGNLDDLRKLKDNLDNALSSFKKKAEELKLDVSFGDATQSVNKYIDDVFKADSERTGGKIDEGEEVTEEVTEEEIQEEVTEETSSKMKVSELKAKIKEDIISLLQEEDEVDIEDEIEADDVEVDVEEPTVDATSPEVGLSSDEQEIQDSLKLAYDNAVAIGDEKLADQIGNSITFFTRTHVVER